MLYLKKLSVVGLEVMLLLLMIVTVYSMRGYGLPSISVR